MVANNGFEYSENHINSISKNVYNNYDLFITRTEEI